MTEKETPLKLSEYYEDTDNCPGFLFYKQNEIETKQKKKPISIRYDNSAMYKSYIELCEKAVEFDKEKKENKNRIRSFRNSYDIENCPVFLDYCQNYVYNYYKLYIIYQETNINIPQIYETYIDHCKKAVEFEEKRLLVVR